MSVGPELGVASVLIVPDLRGFEASLLAGVNKATAAASVAGVGAGRGAAAAKVELAAVGAAAATAAHPLEQVAASMTAVGAATGRTVKVTGDYIAASRTLAPSLAQQARASQLAAVAENERLLALKQTVVVATENTVAAEREAVALNTSAAAARKTALAHEQFARGAGASGLTLFGLRGATLAASAPFLIGTAAVVSFGKAVEETSAHEEAAARVTKILGAEAGHTAETFALGLAPSFGLSATEALRFEGAIAEVFHNVGLADKQTQQFSQSLVKLSADVGAFNNADPSQVLRAFQLGLSGNLRGLRQFVPGVTAARVALQAMADTGKKVKANLTDQELTVARYEVILQAASNQVGSFADRSGNLAAQTKILKSDLANLAVSIGGALIPVLGPATKLAAALATNLSKLAGASKKQGDATAESSHRQSGALRVVNAVIDESGREYGILIKLVQRTDKAVTDVGNTLGGPFAAQTGAASSALDHLGGVATVVGNQLAFGGVATRQLGADFVGLIDPINAASAALAAFRANLAAISGARSTITNLTNQALALQIQHAGGPERIGNLQKQIAAQRDILKAVGGPRGKTGRDALAAIAQDVAQIDAINAAEAAASAKGAGAAKAAGKSAQEILDEEDQRLQTEQQIAVTDNDIALAKARQTKSLVDDLAADRARVRLYEQQLKDAQRIHDAVTRRQTIQQLTLDRLQAQADIADAIAEQRQRRRDRLVNAADARVQSAQLDADLAETLGHKGEQVSALKRENAALEAERKLWVGNTLKQKEIRNQIAENNAKIKEIKGLTDDRNRLSSELAFSFLQAQQGFAATVMSNLLSAGAVAGAVGGTSGAISTATAGPGPAAFATAVHQRPVHPDAALTTASAAGAIRGATAGQMGTLISVNRAILAAIRGQTGRLTHPEAHYQTYTSSTEMAHSV